MAGYARPRFTNQCSWGCVELRDLEGTIIRDWLPHQLWVKSICFDAMDTGLYVLTEDDDFYFTVHSADLIHANEIPTNEMNGDNMKTQTTSRPAGFMRMQETVVTRYPSVKFLSGQELTDTEKDYLATGQWDSEIVATCDHGYKVIQIAGKYLAVIAHEDCL